jgi:hypothetical protein
MINYEGLEALQHILDYGIKVIGAKGGGLNTTREGTWSRSM